MYRIISLFTNSKEGSILSYNRNLMSHCPSCGAKIKKSDELCPTCRKLLDQVLLFGDTEQLGAGGVGFSDITEHESFTAYRNFTRKIWLIAMPILTAIIIIYLIATGTHPIGAIASGLAVFLLMLIIGLVIRRKKPSWEGTVVEKKYLVEQERKQNQNGYKEVDVYKVFFETESGKKKTDKRKNDHKLYDYLNEGDRVRFLGNLGSEYAYEKYDKSQDLEIMCVSCGNMNDARCTYCTMCGSILLKGRS